MPPLLPRFQTKLIVLFAMSEFLITGVGAIIVLVLVVTVFTSLAKVARTRDAAAKLEATRKLDAKRGGAKAPEIAPPLSNIKIGEGPQNKTKVKMDEIVDKHPVEAVSLIRRWLRNNNH